MPTYANICQLNPTDMLSRNFRVFPFSVLAACARSSPSVTAWSFRFCRPRKNSRKDCEQTDEKFGDKVDGVTESLWNKSNSNALKWNDGFHLSNRSKWDLRSHWFHLSAVWKECSWMIAIWPLYCDNMCASVDSLKPIGKWIFTFQARHLVGVLAEAFLRHVHDHNLIS